MYISTRRMGRVYSETANYWVRREDLIITEKLTPAGGKTRKQLKQSKLKDKRNNNKRLLKIKT